MTASRFSAKQKHDSLPFNHYVLLKHSNIRKKLISMHTNQSYAHKHTRSHIRINAITQVILEAFCRLQLSDLISTDVSLEEIEKFIGLQLARGVLTAKNAPILFLWDEKWGHKFYKNTMARNRFISIM